MGWAGGIGLGGLEGGGSSGWVGVGENPIPEADNNNFVGCKAVVNDSAENNMS